VSGSSHDELLAQVSSDYYLENRPKVEIAASHGISRFQVARLLAEAREKGIVEIKVHFPSAFSGSDVGQLESWLGIRQVVVADSTGDENQARGILAKAASAEITRQAPWMSLRSWSASFPDATSSNWRAHCRRRRKATRWNSFSALGI
jgi:DNA-binding transcriptional regulator LsrR (DeoR family)